MELPLVIEYKTGEKESITCSASDIVNFEDHFDISFTRAAQDLRMTWLLYLGWSPTFASKKTALAFEEWILGVSTVTAVNAKKS